MKSNRPEEMLPVADAGASAPLADQNDHGMPGLALRTAEDFVPADDLAGAQLSAGGEGMLGDDTAEEATQQLVGPVRPSSSPVVAWGPNRLDVFVLGTERALYHKWWGGGWGPSITYRNLFVVKW